MVQIGIKAWWLQNWDRLRQSLWFIPCVTIIGSALFATLMIHVDRTIQISAQGDLGFLVTTSSAARTTLGALASAMMTVTGVVFSVTMLTLAQTSSQFGSRLLRAFLNYNITQVTLGVFLGTSVYCFAVLRVIRELDRDHAFVPHLAVFMGTIFGFVAFISFIAFIHHVAHSIQAENVLQNVAHDIYDSIERLYPDPLKTDSRNRRETSSIDFDFESEINAVSTGYVQAINIDVLVSIAEDLDCVVRLSRRPGDFVFPGMMIAEITAPKPSEPDQQRIANCFLTGAYRTPRQDIGCGIMELTEVAVRALSPGINDPHTAEACLQYQTDVMARLANREFPARACMGGDGTLRVILNDVCFEELLESAFQEIMSFGSATETILSQIADSMLELARQVSRKDDIRAVSQFSNRLKETAQRQFGEGAFASRILAKLELVDQVLMKTDQRSA